LTHVHPEKRPLNGGTSTKIVANGKSKQSIDMHTHASNASDKHVTPTFDLLTSRSMQAKQLMCTKFGVDSSSHFPFREWTHKVIDATDDSIHHSAIAGVQNCKTMQQNLL